MSKFGLIEMVLNSNAEHKNLELFPRINTRDNK